nr:PilC/PilY family type IV pilus protein [Comamonas testosteroni]
MPPLNLLVMGRDHKLYYEAYNDASDLDGDGVIDVGYKPNQLDYYGYFNNNVCYDYVDGVFIPSVAATGDKKKICDKKWSGDFLNYLTTSRMDAIRRVLYGGMRVTDTATNTILQGAYIPRDAHAWAKSYNPWRPGGESYKLSEYSPYDDPRIGTRHLFAVTTLGEPTDANPTATVSKLRVLDNTSFQVWDWVSQEKQAGQWNCAGRNDPANRCAVSVEASNYVMVPSENFREVSITTYKTDNSSPPGGLNAMDTLFSTKGVSGNLCGTGSLPNIDTSGGDNNPFGGRNGCGQDYYMTMISGQIYIPAAGSYKFAIDGDDAVDIAINGEKWGWYGSHGPNRTQAGFESHSKTVNFTSAGWFDITFRHVDGTSNDNWGLAWKVTQPVNEIKDFDIRVKACTGVAVELQEETCKRYGNNAGNPIYKPTGIFHDFGENGKMLFGLLTGSYSKNVNGGVLRRNIGAFTDEVDAQTGVFKTSVDGLVANIDRQRVMGFSNDYYPACGWITSGPLASIADPSRCALWGNPVAEMMFEGMRYFSGASTPLANYAYGAGSNDSKLKLSNPNWRSPYKSTADGGSGYQHCARPVMTVISDINPSYDTKLPGSRFSTVAANAPALTSFDVSAEVDAIGDSEGIVGKQYFIGQTGLSNADQAPTVKRIDRFSWVRGISPQEPSKEGSYYSAGVARYGANNKVFGVSGRENALMTYSVAIASPLPEIRFPVNTEKTRFVTLAPFAKSVTGGTAGAENGVDNSVFTPTNQIVDFYVDKIANTGEKDKDPSINSGRPFASFRINYEDVEQGADHDMDAISQYTVRLTADGKVQVDMASQYAAGGYGQHMGYVISGTTTDGMYLEVRDRDTASVHYPGNTPPGMLPGACQSPVGDAQVNACKSLGLNASRTFTPSTSGAAATFLKDPLWYAAKYGIPDRDPSKITTPDPDNYFLVTNATTLKQQLTKAFNSILQTTSSVTKVAISAPSANLSLGGNVFRTTFEAEFWSGDVISDNLDGSKTQAWSAASLLSTRNPDNRKIFFAGKSATGTPLLKEFNSANLTLENSGWIEALNINPETNSSDGKAAQRIAFLRGAKDDSLRKRKLLDTGAPNVLGDIVNSSIVTTTGALYRAAPSDKLEGTSKYDAFITAQKAKPQMLYVGANDGMLHAFNATTGAEVFTYIPSGLKKTLNLLTAQNYATSHRYFVDGTPVISDVYFGDEWHKVLVGNLGAGGRQIFALDITDPVNPRLLWEFGSDNDADVGYTVPQPLIARLNNPSTTVNGKWAVLLPNGYQGGSSATGAASMFVLDIATGSVLKKVAMPNNMSAEELTALGALGNGLSRLTAVDNNVDGMVDMIYVGDLGGNIWRVNVADGSALSSWSPNLFYTARDGSSATGKRQPISAAPYIIRHPTRKGDLVIVGTGRYVADADRQSAQKQSVYAIWDRYADIGAAAPGTLPTADKTRNDLLGQTFTAIGTDTGAYSLSSNAITWYKSTATGTADTDVQNWGWYVDMPRAGEMLVYNMTQYGLGLVASSVRPSVDPCAAGISSTLYGIDPFTGGKTPYVIYDINNDGLFNAADYIGGKPPAGVAIDGGAPGIHGGKVYNPDGSVKVGVNSGLDLGRKSWRKQPANQ